ncbi:MAG: outer membrane beta-barrel protein [Endomicrobia bacterium]|nr:outer membrane beta-barrel protein [Endomicrobiia bacterium]
MIKKIVFLLLSMIFFAGTAFSSGEVRPYVSFKGAASFVQSDFDLGYYPRYYRGGYYYNNVHYYYDDYYYRNYYDESADTVFAGSASLGMKIKNLRFECEYVYRTRAKQSYDFFPDIRQEFNSLMLNFLYDVPIGSKIYPYAGVGMGATHVKNEIKYCGSESKTCFSFAGDMGVSFELARHINLDTGLKVTYLGAAKLENTDYNMYAIDIYLGLRYTI